MAIEGSDPKNGDESVSLKNCGKTDMNEDYSEKETSIKTSLIDIRGTGVTGNSVDITPATFSYKRRWYVLAVYAVISVTHLACYNTYGPIASSAKAVFEWENKQIALLSSVGPFTVIFFLIPAAWLIKKTGIRYSTILVCGLVLVGSILRWLPISNQLYRYATLTAAVLNGIAGAYLAAGATTLSAAWFPISQRTTATAIYTFTRPFGIALTFLIAPALIQDDSCIRFTTDNKTTVSVNCTVDELKAMEGDIKKLLYAETAVIALCFILTIIYFPSVPPKPPSISAGAERSKYLLHDVKQMLKKWDIWVIALAYSLTTAVHTSWLSCINIFWTPIGVSQKEAGLIVFSSTIGGSITNLLVGRLGARFRRRIKVMLIIITIIGSSFSIWTVIMTLGYLPVEEAFLYISVIAFVSMFSGAGPLFFEIGCEICYPVSESVATSFLTLFLEIMIVIFFTIFFIPNMAINWLNWVFGVSTLISVVLCCVYRPKYNRLKIDESHIK